MAGEPLLFQINTAVIIADEPLRRGYDEEDYQTIAEAGRKLAEAGNLPLLDLRSDETGDGVFLYDDALVERIKSLKRRMLIVCGGLLEGAVTQIALSTLVDAYDVFVPADLVCTLEPEREAMFLSRIAHCGGNVLSHRQVVLELLSTEDETDRRALLSDLLDDIDGN